MATTPQTEKHPVSGSIHSGNYSVQCRLDNKVYFDIKDESLRYQWKTCGIIQELSRGSTAIYLHGCRDK
ncbi:hypothetical protein HHI36_023427 [Cryptolaemus montrouzieri]|uniref:Uncharacterized protein n=1 Tax=Cryptolaemus montrouzieri TaxID=559131 RepID=A0ABD2PGV9_9CUCU